MPDHLHLLVEGTSDTSDLVAFANETKQRTAYRYRRRQSGTLWQKGYFERVLRDDEETLAVARYVLPNPARAGLVQVPTTIPIPARSFSTSASSMNCGRTQFAARPEGRALRDVPATRPEGRALRIFRRHALKGVPYDIP
jgi:hypothetical protein